MKLKTLRRKIDKLDAQLLDLFNSRARLSLEIARLKRRQGKGAYSPDREKEILQRLKKINKGPISAAAVEAIYREIMSSSLSLERPLRIAYLGPSATFTHIAALRKFGSQAEYVAFDDIPGVFLSVEREETDYGVVPVENSIEGVVSHTLDIFVDSELKICNQIVLDVSHYLLSNCPKEKIKRIYSNPQVFAQCRLWLENNLTGTQKVEVSSTSRAAAIASKEKYAAAIASSLAAGVYKLRVIARNIEDSLHNITRFLVIGKTQPSPTGSDRTSILFSIKDKIGALHDMLIPFKKYNINLTKIESRPSKKKAWDYYFFVDLAAHYEEPQVKKALEELQDRCTFLKILGSYPV
jgi:chorismate mutase/prephenate dehydratase